MPALRKDYSEAVKQYLEGQSIEKIATFYGITRQAMWKILVRRGVAMRHLEPAEFVVWNGAKYSVRENGYLAKTIESRSYLHREIWEQHYGPIPLGYEVHHKDEDKRNNALNNLELLTEADHAAAHGFGGNQYVPSLGRRPVK